MEQEMKSIVSQLEDTTCEVIKLMLGGTGWTSKRDTGRYPSPHDPLGALRMAYLCCLSHAAIRSHKLFTKRDVYYMCRALFRSPEAVDRGLIQLSSMLNVHRNDLNIVAAPKGLVVGRVVYVDEFGNTVDVSMFGDAGCLIPARPERMMHILVDAPAIIVVEKEAAFNSLIDESRSEQSLSWHVIVTGKGYPDYATRFFLRRISVQGSDNLDCIPIYILTDSDPHGINIASCYINALRGCRIHWIGIRHSDHGSLFEVQESSKLKLTEKENVLLDGMLARWTENGQVESPDWDDLVTEAKNMKVSQTKFEMEALSAHRGKSSGKCKPGLLSYLMKRLSSCETPKESIAD